NFKEDLCLSLSTVGLIAPEEFVQFKTINWDAKIDTQEDAVELEDELLSQEFTNQISIKYPYHKNIHSYLLDIGKKRIGIIFNYRFYYQNISEEGIYLLPNELKEDVNIFIEYVSKFTILNTNHSLHLFKALNEFRPAWQAYEFNKFTTPFPKFWFLFINQSISKEEWFEMYKADYPDVAEKPIISL